MDPVGEVEAVVEETVKTVEDEIETETAEEILPSSLEDIREFLGIEAADAAEEVDLDSFWDEALEDSDMKPLNSSGMSLEEARQRGLISTEFDQSGRLKNSD